MVRTCWGQWLLGTLATASEGGGWFGDLERDSDGLSYWDLAGGGWVQSTGSGEGFVTASLSGASSAHPGHTIPDPADLER